MGKRAGRRSGGASPQKKKAKTVDPVKEAQDRVMGALDNYEYDMSEEVRELLRAVGARCLGVAVEDRHPYTTQFFDMFNKSYSDIRVSLSKATAEQQNLIDDSDSIRSNNETTRDSLTEQIEAREKQIAQQTEVNNGMKTAFQDAKSDADASQKNNKEVYAERDTNVDSLDEVQSAYENAFKKLLDDPPQSPKDVTKLVKEVCTLLRKVKADDSLVQAYPAALKKPKNVRGPFDVMAITGVEDELTKRIQTLGYNIANQDQREQHVDRDLAAKKEALEIATKKWHKGKEVLEDLKANLAQLQSELETIQDKLDNHDVHVHEAHAKREECAVQEQEFGDILKSLSFLCERRNEELESPEEVPDQVTKEESE